jgi:hypothetical protein
MDCISPAAFYGTTLLMFTAIMVVGLMGARNAYRNEFLYDEMGRQNAQVIANKKRIDAIAGDVNYNDYVLSRQRAALKNQVAVHTATEASLDQRVALIEDSLAVRATVAKRAL